MRWCSLADRLVWGIALAGSLASMPAWAIERTFIGTVSNDWFIAENWVPNGVPGPADDAVIAGGVTVDFQADTQVAGFTLAGATLNGAGSLTVTGLLNWSGGSLAGTGAVNANGDLLVSGDGTKTLARTLNVGRTAIWADNGNLVLNAGRLNVLPGGSFTIQNNRPISAAGGSPLIENSGTLRKTSGGTTTLSNVRLVSTGTVSVQAGTLSLTAGGTYTGVIDAPTATIEFSGGTHNLSTTSSLVTSSLLCNSGTVTSAGAIDVLTRTQVSAGTVTLSGTVNNLGTLVVHNGTLNVSSSVNVGVSSLSLSGGTLTGSAGMTVVGPFTWSGGTLGGSGVLSVSGGIAISGGSTKTLARTLQSSGNATWIDSGSLFLTATGLFEQLSGATWLLQTDASIDGNGGRVQNGGTVRKLSAGITRVNGVAFSNHGELQVEAGTLILGAGGQHTGALRFDGATVELGGNHTFTPRSLIEGSRLVVASGSVSSEGRWKVTGSTDLIGISLALLGVVDELGALTIRNGNLELSPTTGVVAVPSLALSGGALSGSAMLTVGGLLTWSGGTMSGSGSTRANAGLWFAGDGGRTLSRILSNAAEAWWTESGNLSLSGSGRLQNLPGAVFRLQGDASLLGTDSARFINQGLMRKEQGTLTRINTALDNSGLVQLSTGDLMASGGGEHSGRFEAGSGGLELAGGHRFGTTSEVSAARVTFSGGTNEIAGLYAASVATTVSGGITQLRTLPTSLGALTVSNSTLGLFAEGSVTVPSLWLDFGVLDGSTDVSVNGPLRWTGGTMRGTGSSWAMGSLEISGPSPKVLNRRLRNAGAGRWSEASTFTIGDGGHLLNLAGASLVFEGDGNLLNGGGSARLDNAGVLSKSQGALTTITVPTANTGQVLAQSGTLAFNGGYEQREGLTRLQGGAIRSKDALSFRGGRLDGAGSILGSIVNEARLAPGLSAGRLLLTGDYAQTSNGTLEIEIGGTTDLAFDQLLVDGQVDLDGTLAIRLADGFVPQQGDRFRILTGGSLRGDFTSVNGQVITLGKGFDREVDPDGMTLVYGEEDCTDHIDNDGDGGSDCGDPKCAAYEPCGYTPTPTATPTDTPTTTPTPTATPTATIDPGPCSGDCNADGEVTIDELLRSVNIALELAGLDSCPSVDLDDSTAVEINELIVAVNQALLGCDFSITSVPRPAEGSDARP